MTSCLAIDIGATKLAVALVDPEGEIRVRAQVPTGPEERPEESEALFGRLVALIDEVVSSGSEAPLTCGVGCGGPMTRGGAAVSPLNIGAWRAFPLRDRLAQRLGLPVAVDNDAKVLALGERWRGAARGEDNFMAMVVSSGIGGGIVLDGRLLEGAGGNAGHVGHVIVEPDGRPCRCGGRGCLEAEASGLSVAAATGVRPEVADEGTIRRVGRLVGRGVADVVSLLDLPLVVVAGSVALGFGHRFFEAAQEELERRAGLDFTTGAVIRPAGLGSDGPLVGAAALGWQQAGRDVSGRRR